MATGSFHTDTLSAVPTKQLNGYLAAMWVRLKHLFPSQPITVYSFDSCRCAFALTVPVDLPSRQPAVSILSEEPILIAYRKDGGPDVAPTVFSNRLDFPAEQLAHLNPTPLGHPACFCLIRGDVNDWYATKTVDDVVERTRQWLSDAATGALQPADDEFEFIRFAQRTGFVLYDEDELVAAINEHWSRRYSAAGRHVGLFAPLTDKSISSDYFAPRIFRLIKHAGTDDTTVNTSFLKRFNLDNPDQRISAGLVLWPTQDVVFADYFTNVPDTLGAFIAWADKLGFALSQMLNTLISRDLYGTSEVPILLVFKRPRKVIGYSSELEIVPFITFIKEPPDGSPGRIDTNVPVLPMSSVKKHTPQRAKMLSGFPTKPDKAILLVGCGALGSKVSLHLARSGTTGQTLVDADLMQFHNVSRHALLGASIWANKAVALKEQIQQLYPLQTLTDVEAKEQSIQHLLRDDQALLNRHRTLIDATASKAVERFWQSLPPAKFPRLARIELAHNGNVGLLRVEGANRNPRIDDLWYLLHDQAIENDALSRWLQTDEEQVRKERFAVGQNCSSDTFLMADETVSLHAAALTDPIRRQCLPQPSTQSGLLHYQYVGEHSALHTCQLNVSPVREIRLENRKGWTVRMTEAVAQSMHQQLLDHKPNETGGVVIGHFDKVNQIVYVTRLVDAPPDSVRKPTEFTRGNKGLPKQINTIRRRTGGLIDYIGEWHTHPEGGRHPSPKDLRTVGIMRRRHDHFNYPTLLFIITPTRINPYLYGNF